MTTLSRRSVLDQLAANHTTNAGLWLDKFLSAQLESNEVVGSDSATPQAELIDQVTTLAVPQSYTHYFSRWQQSLEALGAICKEATVNGRMVLGLGAESVLETTITLHRVYGVPYIPGSALKGLTAMYARNKLDEQSWGIDSEAYSTLFGTTESAGVVTFHDALHVVPKEGQSTQPLHKDVLTVHHKEYYDGNTDSPPADWDSPVIVTYLSATGTYLLALSGPAAWVDSAYEILALALAEDGIGAKTSSGYGRMRLGGTKDAIAKVTGAPTQTVQPTTAQEYAQRRQELLNRTPPSGRYYGTVANVREDRGFGFANPITGGEQVFIHFSNLRSSGVKLRSGQIIEFALDPSRPKPSALEVDILLDPVD